MPGPTLPSALLLTQHYWPEPIGSAPYTTDVAEHLAAEGAAVAVFTCRPHYPAGRVPEDYAGGDRDRETRRGVAIERVAPFRPRGSGALGRLVREGAFLMRGLAALAAGRVRRADLTVSLCPSILTVLLGAAARRRGGRHVVLVHDIQSGLAAALGMAGRFGLGNAIKWLERVALDRADTVLVLSSNMKAILRAQGVRAPIEILPIWVDTHAIRPREDTAEPARVTVVYSGNLGRKQGLGQVVDMAERLQRRNRHVEVLLRGAGSEAVRLARDVAARGLVNVRFAPLVAPERFAASLADGTIHLVPQDPGAADFAVPSKAYAIMASGRPFVATARPGSQLWDLRRRSDAFLCVAAGDADALADAVERLALDPSLRARLGRNGRAYAVAHHDRALVLGRFMNIAGLQPAGKTWQHQASRIS